MEQDSIEEIYDIPIEQVSTEEINDSPIDQEVPPAEIIDDKTTPVEEINNSPIEQVRLTVPITDDNTLPVLTIRTWVLGLSACIIVASTNAFFSYRQQKDKISPASVKIIILLLGKLMAMTLPKKIVAVPLTKWRFSLNPGDFNAKEHALTTLLANADYDPVQGLGVVTLVRAIYKKKLSSSAAFFFIISSQLIGCGFAGFFIKLLVDSPIMWWPTELTNVTFFRTMNVKGERVPRGKLTKVHFFIIVSVCSFAYYVVPEYIFPPITALSFVCWIWRDSVVAQQIGSASTGLGIGIFSLDWNSINDILGSPFEAPIDAILNVMAGFILILYVIAPIAYWTNLYHARRFPFFSMDAFDDDGQYYDLSRILNSETSEFSEEGYEGYSKVHLSTFYAFAYGFWFAAVSSSLTHVAIFYGRSFWHQFKATLHGENKGDVHNRLMKNYDPVPQWWFYIVSILMVALAIFATEIFGKQLQIPALGVILACVLGLILVLPIGLVKATTSQDLEVSILCRLIVAYLYPGKPFASVTFIAYCETSMQRAISTLSTFKLGHYLKIPPKSMFICLIVGIVVSSSTDLVVASWIIRTVHGLCDETDLPKGSPWTCPRYTMPYSDAIIWGLVGPSRIFAPHGIYWKMYIFFFVGAIAPILVWVLMRMFPKTKWIQLINFPLIFAVGSTMPPATAANYWSWGIVGILFNYVAYKYYKEWWTNYNYLLSAGLEAGAAFMDLLVGLALHVNKTNDLSLWDLERNNTCSLARCPTAPGVDVDGCPNW